MKCTPFRVNVLFLLALLPALAFARLDAPDHVLYGNVSLFGRPVAEGTMIEVRIQPTNVVLARYSMGRDPVLGGQYALRIPMDTVNPRQPGKARLGDPIHVFIGTRLAAETTVGAEGVAVRLDLDPQSMGTGPAIDTDDIEVLEGEQGITSATFTLTLNTTSATPVSVAWVTEAGTATGGATCSGGVDFLNANGVAEVPAGSLSQTVTVGICGDTTIEQNETFTLVLGPVDGGVLVRGSAVATILDDDDVPSLAVADARVLEPVSGTAELVFRPRLSRTSTVPVMVQFTTQDAGATAGQDYLAASGSVTIAPGELEGEIRVTVLADDGVEPNEHVRLVLSAPQAVRLARAEAFGTIVDPQHDPALVPMPELPGGPGGVPGLLQPSAVALSADGRFAYVASDSLHAVLTFARTPSSGALTLVNTVSAATSGFSAAKLRGARDLAISPDGRHVYVAGREDDAIVVLGRDTDAGTLTFVQNKEHQTLQGVRALRVSADNQHVYAVSGLANALVVYRRDPDNGALTFVEAERNGINDPTDSGGVVIAMDRPASLALSADGQSVYVASRFGNAVNAFARVGDSASPDFGKLSFRTSYRNGLLGVDGLAGASGLVLSPDNHHLYAVAEGSNAIVLFDRAADGTLAFRARWTKGDSGIFGLGGAQGIAIAPNGVELFVTGFADNSLTVFARTTAAGPEQGMLQVRQTVFDDEGPVTLMQGPLAIAASGDDKHVYLAASIDNAIVLFYRTTADSFFSDGFE
jgi:6-phosphogluconolactonase (cycloisomerase 2 family)